MTQYQQRLSGLDLARFLAFAGMVIVNFNIASAAVPDGGVFQFLMLALEGRAAATFIVLAGIGLGLSVAGKRVLSLILTLKRSAFLMVIGLLNMLVFDADIIHYYAVFFLFGSLFLTARSGVIVAAIIGLMLVGMAMLLGLEFDNGWNWETYVYADFWTVQGFIRHTFYNGWHPVFPWLGFLLLGILLARLPLDCAKTHKKMVVFGALFWAAAELLSSFLTAQVVNDPDLVVLLQTAPVPAVPLYLVAGAGAACFIIGLCLMAGNAFSGLGVFRILCNTGRQTLTLYFAHIFIGMGIMEALGLLDSPAQWQAMLASALFICSAVIYVQLYQRFFKRGPIEGLMWQLTR